jgi:hypothetical protein
MHVDDGVGVTMTGEKTKMLLCSLPFVFEDVFTPEVKIVNNIVTILEQHCNNLSSIL